MPVFTVAFPRIYKECSTREVLVMELIHGVPIDRIPPEHVALVTGSLREAFLAMCFEHGLVHADLHPGNILVRPDASSCCSTSASSSTCPKR